MGGLTGKPGTRTKTSGEAAGKWGEGFLAAKPLFTRSCTTRFGPAFPHTKTASYAGYFSMVMFTYFTFSGSDAEDIDIEH